MKKRFLTGIVVACLAWGCSDKDKSECDDSYVGHCDNGGYSACRDGKIERVACNANETCVDLAGGAVCRNTMSCTHDAPVCLNANASETCVGGASHIEPCALGCIEATGECKKGCGTEGGLRCDPDNDKAIQVCRNGNWRSSGETCKLGCQSGACVKPPKCDKACKDDGTVTITCPGQDPYDVACAIACDRDKNDCIDMAVADTGSACAAASYPDHCVGSILAYCGNSKISEAFCIGASTCQVSEQLSGFGACAKTCDQPGDVVSSCQYDEKRGGYYVLKSVCETIDGTNYLFRNPLDYCYTGCNATNTGCALAKENTSCNPDTDKAESCSDDGKYTIFCEQSDKIWTGDVCPEGTKCLVDSKQVADCYEPCDASQAGTERYTCKTVSTMGVPQEFSIHAKCSEVSSGKYAWVMDDKDGRTACTNACSSQDGKCAKAHADEGKACDTGSYAARCDGAVALFCAKDDANVTKVTAVDCKSHYGEDYVCGFNGGKITCVESCKTEGAKQNRCVFGNSLNFETVEYVCQKDTQSGLIWKASKTIQTCSDACNDDYTGCAKLVSDEYTKCDVNTFKERCEVGAVVYCNEGVVQTVDCEQYGYQCRMSGSVAGCRRPCNVEGTVTRCDPVTSETYTTECIRLDNGEFAEFVNEGSEKSCSKGCNNALTGCKTK